MSSFTTPRSTPNVYIPPGPGALTKYLKQYGKLPPVTMSIFPLQFLGDTSGGGRGLKPNQAEIPIEQFMSYSFKSSILSPVDEFTCQLKVQDPSATTNPLPGDIFALKANGVPIGTGIVDQTEVETDSQGGNVFTISGRNLLGQWEDQDAVNISTQPFYANKATVQLVVKTLAQDTRINPATLSTPLAPKQAYLFATQPGESKLSAMQRYCEGLDLYFWLNGDGTLNVGRPNMLKQSTQVLFCSFNGRQSNVLSIRSVRATTQIPNIVVPLWNGQEAVQNRQSVNFGALCNGSAGPNRLYRLGHRVPKAVVVSTPEGDSPQDLSEINTLIVSGQSIEAQKKNGIQRAGAANITQVYAKREMARANIKELNVQIQMMGHFNDNLEPFFPDQVYHIQYDVDNIAEDMYLYEVEYFFDEQGSQRTRLFFCRQTAIVADKNVFYAL